MLIVDVRGHGKFLKGQGQYTSLLYVDCFCLDLYLLLGQPFVRLSLSEAVPMLSCRNYKLGRLVGPQWRLVACQ